MASAGHASGNSALMTQERTIERVVKVRLAKFELQRNAYGVPKNQQQNAQNTN